MDVAYLHFVLEQVTERKEEVASEHFCRRLAEKEICPNLITQTGPTGGGDSKVDTETHPLRSASCERERRRQQDASWATWSKEKMSEPWPPQEEWLSA